MKRRSFIQVSSTITALLASGRMPLFAADASDRNIFTDPPAIEPITGKLPTFTPKTGSTSMSAYSSTYNLIRWTSATDLNPSTNVSNGSLQISRTSAGVYTAVQNITLPGANQLCFFQVDVATQGTLNEATGWTVSGYHNEKASTSRQRHSEIELVGQKSGSAIVISGTNVCFNRTVTESLVPLWALPDTLAVKMAASNTSTFTVAVLEDGLVIRPNQQFDYEGAIQVPCAAGTVTFYSWRQTGPGVLPTHWVFDSSGRAQLMTHSKINWILSSRT